jgi:hypothetical protein
MTLFLLTGAAVAALCFAALLLVGFVLKLAFWLVFLPFRVLFKLVFGIGGLLIGVLAAPIVLLLVAIGVIVAVLAALAAIVLPLLPVILLGLGGWAIYRGAGRRASPVT